MNSSSTWTSRVRMGDRICTRPKSTDLASNISQDSLRLVQKTSGLFDTDKSSNEIVASTASKTGLDLDFMDPVMMTGEELGGLFQDMPTGLTEEDYLDSFMDLSGFLLPEVPKALESGVDDEEMKEKSVNFSDLTTLLTPEPILAEAAEDVFLSSTSPRKRKAVTAFETDTVVMLASEPGNGGSVYDHDYVSKKLKKVSEDKEYKPAPSTSKSAEKSNTKYRERRDKNNVASRRSRQIRKQKFAEMDKEADRLVERNECLRKKIEELEGLAKVMKEQLIKKMTTK